MPARPVCGALLLYAALFPPIQAQTITADPGDDLNLIEDQLAPGDILVLNAGTYNASGGKWEIIDASNGTASQPIEVRADGVVWVRPRIRITRNYFIFDGINVDVAENGIRGYSIDGHHVTVKNAEVKRGHRNGIDINNHDVTIENCTIHDFDGGDYHGIALIPNIDAVAISGCTIYDCEGDCIQLYNGGSDPRAFDVLIEDCTLYTTRGSGSENAVDIKASHDVTVRDCIMYGFRDSVGSDGSAVVIHQNADNIIVDGCTIYDSAHGIRMGSQSDNVTVQRCIFRDIYGGANWNAIQIDDTNGADILNCTFYNVGRAVRFENGPSGVSVINCILQGSEIDLNYGTASVHHNLFWQTPVQGSSALEGDPEFVSPGTGNFALKDTSPAIDQGVDVGLPYFGSAPDMGAIEFEVDETPPLVSVTGVRLKGTVSDDTACPAEVTINGSSVVVNVSGLSGDWASGDLGLQAAYTIIAADASGNTASVVVQVQ